ncbi:nucleolar protein 7-like [Patiria miniata]|uniref:Uncharacterized protein n=1 Tax=Patiria miniata TaxID=46514 RepID=A0A914AEP2_PATMI|nr:nucleolar protein 7-like [Patiria miniata]XP_038062199.1 nucleolar protein 7-like [Patiria miniata]
MKKQSHRMTKSESTTVSSMEEDLEEVDEMESDDEAPEAVSFNQGRKEALESISHALQDLQRVKLKAKERRRDRDKLLKEQKQKKKVSLSKARLPPELLDKLAQQQDSTLEQSEKSQDQPQTESSPTEETTDRLREDDEDSDFEDFDDLDEEKDPSTIQIIQRSKVHHPPPNEAARQFLQNQLYGSRIPRESMTKNVSRKLKRLGKPGVNFHHKKSLGVKKKKGKRSPTLDQ